MINYQDFVRRFKCISKLAKETAVDGVSYYHVKDVSYINENPSDISSRFSVESNNDSCLYIMCEREFDNPKEIESYKENLEDVVLLQHPNILKIEAYSIKEEEFLGQTKYRIFVVSENYLDTLEKRVQSHREKNTYFKEAELNDIFFSVFNGLLFWEQQEVFQKSFLDLTPSEIVYCKGGGIKLKNFFLKVNILNTRRLEKMFNTLDNLYFLPPYLLKKLKLNGKSKKAIPAQAMESDEGKFFSKAAIFSLGMCLLYTVTLESNADCYDLTNFEINGNKLRRKLTMISSILSPKSMDLLKTLLIVDEDSRPDIFSLERQKNVTAAFIKTYPMPDKERIDTESCVPDDDDDSDAKASVKSKNFAILSEKSNPKFLHGGDIHAFTTITSARYTNQPGVGMKPQEGYIQMKSKLSEPSSKVLRTMKSDDPKKGQYDANPDQIRIIEHRGNNVIFNVYDKKNSKSNSKKDEELLEHYVQGAVVDDQRKAKNPSPRIRLGDELPTTFTGAVNGGDLYSNLKRWIDEAAGEGEHLTPGHPNDMKILSKKSSDRLSLEGPADSLFGDMEEKLGQFSNPKQKTNSTELTGFLLKKHSDRSNVHSNDKGNSPKHNLLDDDKILSRKVSKKLEEEKTKIDLHIRKMDSIQENKIPFSPERLTSKRSGLQDIDSNHDIASPIRREDEKAMKKGISKEFNPEKVISKQLSDLLSGTRHRTGHFGEPTRNNIESDNQINLRQPDSPMKINSGEEQKSSQAGSVSKEVENRREMSAKMRENFAKRTMTLEGAEHDEQGKEGGNKGTSNKVLKPEYDGEYHDGMKHGRGRIKYPNGDKYEGSFVADKKEGYGIYSFADGGKYSGMWKNNKRHGEGRDEYASGDVYIGSYENGEMVGKGSFFFHNGDKYDGEVKDSLKNGSGKYYYNNGGRYEGNWVNDERSGNGEDEMPNGNHYKGEFVNDKPHGRGKLTLANGDTYEGSFVRGNRDGKGTYIFKSGNRYDGYWKNNLKEGSGTFCFANGSTFTGVFRSGKREGLGEYVDPSGKRWHEVWNADKLVERNAV